MLVNVKNIDIANLTIEADAVSKVLNEHGVFGHVNTEFEAHDFVKMVEAHALLEDHNPLEITYRATHVRVFVHTRVMCGIALIMKIVVTPHPSENPKISYSKIASDIDARILALKLSDTK